MTMITLINQTRKETPQPGIDYCENVFEVSDQQQPVVNVYKCNQRHFSALDMWNIQKQRKEISIGTVGQTRIDLPLQVESN